MLRQVESIDERGGGLQYLILGADGYIGSYLYKKMMESGLSVIGTSRKKQNKDMIYFDLINKNIDRVINAVTEEEKTAIFCIAESNIDACFMNYKDAYHINVVLTKLAIDSLVKNGFHVIFFSSDNVFNGKEGIYTEASKAEPINAYGKMKRDIEDYLIEYQPDVCIFRLAKVLSLKKERQNLLFDWENRIKQQEISCIRGNVISVVYIEDVYKACIISSYKKWGGVFHIAGNQSYSRKELAEKFCDIIGVKDVKIAEYGIEHFSFKDTRRPLNVSMSNRKFVEKTGFQFMSAENIFRKYVESMNNCKN